MYRELGGRSEYEATPLRELQEIHASIAEEWRYQAELDAEQKAQIEEQKAEMERQRRQQDLQQRRIR